MNKKILLIFLGCIFSLCSARSYKKMSKAKSTIITEISSKELKKILDEDDTIILINAMPTEIYNDCHIKAAGSINAPFDQTKSEWKKWEKNLLKNHPNAKNEPIYVYCASRACAASQTACKKLKSLGFKKIFEYKGGIREWLETYGQDFCVGDCEREYLHQ